MKIETMHVEDLAPYAGNAKEHPDWQVDQIVASIEEFGNCDPVAVWTNPEGVCEIVEGHGRLMALKKMGAPTVPVIKLDHLTDEQRRAYALVHNQLTMNTGFDMGILAGEVEAVEDIDMSAFGFDMDDIMSTLGGPALGEYQDVDEVEPPEVQETVCKKGDVWLLGEHRLVCGDSTDPGAFAKLMEDRQADLLLTDPPYNVALGHHMRPSEAKQLHRRTDGLVIDNDSWEDDDEFVEFLAKVYGNCLDHMREGAAFYIWHASTQALNFLRASEAAGMQIRQQLMWVKNNFALGRQDYQWRHEPCLYGWKDGAAHTWMGDRKQSTVYEDEMERDINAMKKEELQEYCKELRDALRVFKETVLRFDKPSKSVEHPTMKPVKLMAYQIENSTKQGDLVLDPFGGSGSTLMACEQLGRACRTMELDPHYCDVIIKRWETLTGEKAERA